MTDRPSRLKIAVAIATAGRREQLLNTLCVFAAQTRPADTILVCPASDDDMPSGTSPVLALATVVRHPVKGSCAQRNALISAAHGHDVIAFFDDDFYPDSQYLARVERAFLASPGLVGVTGKVLADGATTRGISHADAEAIRRQPHADQPSPALPAYGLYGCNMAFRLETIVRHNVRFDENLPLYGWLEDTDFSRQVAPYGDLLRDESLRGVHLGIKNGRTSGVRFGYSQVANPIYLWRKGTLTGQRALVQLSRNVLRNLAKVLTPEPWIDRRGRMRGNLAAMRHLATGRLDPRFVQKL
jgi:GT2 family glycosyltransferase